MSLGYRNSRRYTTRAAKNSDKVMTQVVKWRDKVDKKKTELEKLIEEYDSKIYPDLAELGISGIHKASGWDSDLNAARGFLRDYVRKVNDIIESLEEYEPPVDEEPDEEPVSKRRRYSFRNR